MRVCYHYDICLFDAILSLYFSVLPTWLAAFDDDVTNLSDLRSAQLGEHPPDNLDRLVQE